MNIEQKKFLIVTALMRKGDILRTYNDPNNPFEYTDYQLCSTIDGDQYVVNDRARLYKKESFDKIKLLPWQKVDFITESKERMSLFGELSKNKFI